MKTLIAFVTILTFTLNSFAQDQKKTETQKQDKKAKVSKAQGKEVPLKKVIDMVLMTQGKMVVFKDHKFSPMEKEITMKNGTVVKPDGTILMKDGKTRMMGNGDHVDMEGNITEAKKVSKPTDPAKKK